jgi:hypothetical protein
VSFGLRIGGRWIQLRFRSELIIDRHRHPIA